MKHIPKEVTHDSQLCFCFTAKILHPTNKHIWKLRGMGVGDVIDQGDGV